MSKFCDNLIQGTGMGARDLYATSKAYCAEEKETATVIATEPQKTESNEVEPQRGTGVGSAELYSAWKSMKKLIAK